MQQQKIDVNSQTMTEETDKRIPRRRMLKRAIASYNDRSISMEVVVRDLSDTGARIKLKENDLLPDHFTLFVELDGILVDCEAIWRRGLEVGAKFVGEIQDAQPSRAQSVVATLPSDRPVNIRKKPITP